jgi:ArsR family transcriptional regulator
MTMMTSSGVDPGLALARFCRALGHPVRVTIIRFLEARPHGATCGEIVEQLPLSQSTVSEHLRVLRKAGLVESRPAPPRVVYHLHAPALVAFRREANAL